MNTIKQMLALAVILGTFALGFLCSKKCSTRPVEAIERRDTVTVIDTITIREPVYVEKEITRTELLTVTDTIRTHDTLYMYIPIETKHYSNSLYDVWVSGYRASLDSISVYPRTVYITTERTIVPQASKPKRWGIGIQAGYGITATASGINAAPYIGVGVSYNLIRF